MPTTKRRRHTSVIERLLAQPYRFELIQTMRMLDLWLRRNGVAHDETPCAQREIRQSGEIVERTKPSRAIVRWVHACYRFWGGGG